MVTTKTVPIHAEMILPDHIIKILDVIFFNGGYQLSVLCDTSNDDTADYFLICIEDRVPIERKKFLNYHYITTTATNNEIRHWFYRKEDK